MVSDFTRADAGPSPKFIYANKYVLVIFMEKDTENEANILELTKKFKQVKFLQVQPSKAPNLVSEYDVMSHELPTFLFIEDKNEKDKLATGLSYQQLNGSGVTTEKLGDQISIVFRI